MTSPQFYLWKNFNCAYTVHGASCPDSKTSTIVLIHPIGVGLSKLFWQPFIQAWLNQNPHSVIYNPDLMGCGDCDLPSVAYYTDDWADQLQFFIENVVQQPVTLIVQGASFPIAIKLISALRDSKLIQGLVLSTPPAWRTMTKPANPLSSKLLWNLLFNSPVGLGNLFYRYARRRQFIASFSVRQLFANPQQVDAQWLDTLEAGAKDPQTRYAVFSFLAGFWREDYTDAINAIAQPTLVVWGKQTSSISRESLTETLQGRTDSYAQHLDALQICTVEGRNVLPVESTSQLVEIITPFWHQITVE